MAASVRHYGYAEAGSADLDRLCDRSERRQRSGNEPRQARNLATHAS